MSVIYFAQRADGTGPIKIGVSAHLESRMRQMSSDYRASFTVLATAPGDYMLERNLHLKFAKHRVEVRKRRKGRETVIPGCNEWFAACPEVIAFIAKVKRTGIIKLPKSDCRERIFAERYLAGETLEQIAADFDITRERVRQVLRSTGVPSLGYRPEHMRREHELTPAEHEAARLYQSDIRPSEISERTGLSVAQIYGALRRLNIPRKGTGHWNKTLDDQEVARLYRQGLPMAEIAKRTGMAHGTYVYRCLARVGIKPRGKGKWSLEPQAAAIIAAYRGGATYDDLARRFGASIGGVSALIHRHGAVLSDAEKEARRIAAVRVANKRRYHADTDQAHAA